VFDVFGGSEMLIVLFLVCGLLMFLGNLVLGNSIWLFLCIEMVSIFGLF